MKAFLNSCWDGMGLVVVVVDEDILCVDYKLRDSAQVR